jgi:hypothetical protein
MNQHHCKSFLVLNVENAETFFCLIVLLDCTDITRQLLFKELNDSIVILSKYFSIVFFFLKKKDFNENSNGS